MGSFAQEDIPEGSKPNPGNREMPLGNGSLVETVVAAALGTYYLWAGRKENFRALPGATHRQMKGLFRLRAKNLFMGRSGEWDCQRSLGPATKVVRCYFASLTFSRASL